MITTSHRKELLSRAYVEAVAGCCGMALSVPYPDYGVDIILHQVVATTRGVDGKQIHVNTGYALEVQLKSTVTAVVSENEVTYDLEAKAYAKLSNPNLGCQRILVLLVLPRDEQRWVVTTEDGLCLCGCAYWTSLKGASPEPGKTKVRITIPRSNVFSPKALGCIMKCIVSGGAL